MRSHRTVSRTLSILALGLAVVLTVGACAQGQQAKDATVPSPMAPGDPSPAPTVQAVADRYGFLNGEVTFSATNPPWQDGDWARSSRTMSTIFHDGHVEGITVVSDPVPVGTGCQQAGPAPVDAEALAASIRSDPDLDATEPVPIRIAGIEALQMDVVTAPGASICDDPYPLTMLFTEVSLWDRHRYRLYLLDVPRGSSRTLAISIFAKPARFEQVMGAAAPVLDSFEFRTR